MPLKWKIFQKNLHLLLKSQIFTEHVAGITFIRKVWTLGHWLQHLGTTSQTTKMSKPSLSLQSHCSDTTLMQFCRKWTRLSCETYISWKSSNEIWTPLLIIGNFYPFLAKQQVRVDTRLINKYIKKHLMVLREN